MHACAAAVSLNRRNPTGQLRSLYTAPSSSHSEPSTTGVTTASPLHTSPGGHAWQLSVLGLMMYS
eukprot:1007543-Rhodomonas_salina.1